MPKAGLPTNFCAEPRTGADGPHDRLLSGAGIGGVWPAAHRGRSAPGQRKCSGCICSASFSFCSLSLHLSLTAILIMVPFSYDPH